MVKYESIGNEEYARLDVKITADDPVGSLLLDKYYKNPGGKIRFCRNSLKPIEAIHKLESGQMTKEEYQDLLKRTMPKSFTQKHEERKSAKILDSDLIKILFGETITEETKKEILRHNSTRESLAKYLEGYIQSKLGSIPEETRDAHEQGILRAVRSGKLDDLGFRLTQLHGVLVQKGDWRGIKYNRDLYPKFCEATQKGNVFEIGEIVKQHEKDFKF